VGKGGLLNVTGLISTNFIH